MQELTERSVNACASECTQWVHPEARSLTERSLSNWGWLAGSKGKNQSSWVEPSSDNKVHPSRSWLSHSRWARQTAERT